jgi:elongation factor Ts
MHIAASNPEFVRQEEITESAKNLAKEAFAKEVEGKPAEMKEKILEGKLSAYFAERVLLEQPFIKNPEIKVKTLIDNAVQKFGEKIEIGRVSRFSVKS